MEDDGPVEDEEGLIDEEPTPLSPIPSPYRPYYQPYCNHGNSPLLMRTLRMHVPPLSHLDTFTYVSQPISGQKRKLTFPYELARLTDLLGKRVTTNDPPQFKIGKYS